MCCAAENRLYGAGDDRHSAICTCADRDDFWVLATREIDETRGRVRRWIGSPHHVSCSFTISNVDKHEPSLLEGGVMSCRLVRVFTSIRLIAP